MALVVVALLVAGASPVFAGVPPVITYQGKLADKAGQPVPDGNYIMDFAIYSMETGGLLIWQETGRRVAVAGGVFTVMLGEVLPLPEAGFPKGGWLQVAVAGLALSPRTELVSAPYALRAHTAEHVLETAAVTSLNSLTGDVTLQAGENLTLSQVGSTITLSGESIPNPLPVSQSGVWTMGISGTPSVNVANSPVVRIDASQNTVKAPAQSSYIQLWTDIQTVAAGANLWSPNISCDGFREIRLHLRTTMSYSQPELIRINVRTYCSGGWLLLGTGNFNTASAQPITGANFSASTSTALLTVPVFAPQMRIEIVNEKTSSIQISANCTAYLVN